MDLRRSLELVVVLMGYLLHSYCGETNKNNSTFNTTGSTIPSSHEDDGNYTMDEREQRKNLSGVNTGNTSEVSERGNTTGGKSLDDYVTISSTPASRVHLDTNKR